MSILSHHAKFILREIGYALIFTACIMALSGGVVLLYAVLNAGMKWHDILQLIKGLI
jgi:hypothetical protein